MCDRILLWDCTFFIHFNLYRLRVSLYSDGEGDTQNTQNMFIFDDDEGGFQQMGVTLMIYFVYS